MIFAKDYEKIIWIGLIPNATKNPLGFHVSRQCRRHGFSFEFTTIFSNRTNWFKTNLKTFSYLWQIKISICFIKTNFLGIKRKQKRASSSFNNWVMVWDGKMGKINLAAASSWSNIHHFQRHLEIADAPTLESSDIIDFFAMQRVL